jgi:hypothetical protein
VTGAQDENEGALGASRARHDSPRWYLLTAEAATHIRNAEGSDPVFVSKVWSYNRCPIHYGSYQTRQDVIGHLRLK